VVYVTHEVLTYATVIGSPCNDPRLVRRNIEPSATQCGDQADGRSSSDTVSRTLCQAQQQLASRRSK
jgi:hypothetical protein